jgi:Tol biopolymer transport system component
MSLPAGTYNDPVWTAEGDVAFVGQSNLWLSTVDGRERRPLIPGKVTASEPAVSADGRFVVFVSQRGNSRNLWRIGMDGTNLRQVTRGQYDWHLALSPDGQWVAYESRAAGQRALWKAPLSEAGSPLKLVDNEGAEGIAIAPDSTLFAYRTDLGEIGIRSLDDGKLVRTLAAPADPSDLSWSPDGKTIAYVCHMGRSVQLWNQPVDGGSAVRIREPLPNDVLHIAWSRDASRIVYLHREIKADLALLTNFR